MKNASRALVLLWFTLQYSLYIDTLILVIVVKESLPCQMCCCRTQSSSFSADRGETGGKNEEAGGKWAECVKKMNVWWFWICEPCTQVHGRARWLSVWIHRVWGDKAALLACHQAATKAALDDPCNNCFIHLHFLRMFTSTENRWKACRLAGAPRGFTIAVIGLPVFCITLLGMVAVALWWCGAYFYALILVVIVFIYRHWLDAVSGTRLQLVELSWHVNTMWCQPGTFWMTVAWSFSQECGPVNACRMAKSYFIWAATPT